MARRLANHVVPIVEEDVTVYLAEMESNTWVYSVWSGERDDETLLSVDTLEFGGSKVTPLQVARIAFLVSHCLGES